MNNLNRWFSPLRAAKLTSDERQKHWAVLRAAMHTTPLDRWPSSPIWLRWSLWRVAAVTAAVAMVFDVGAGFAIAASRSLPGDRLYGVKVNVLEPVESTLAVTPAAQARVALHQVQRRLDEAEQLQRQDKLTEQHDHDLSVHITQRSQALERAAAELEVKDKTDVADDVTQQLQVTLEKHAKDLKGDEHPSVNPPVTVNDLSNAIQHQQQASVDGKCQAAKNKLSEVQRLLDRQSSDLKVETVANLTAQITTLTSNIADITQTIQSQGLAATFRQCQQTLRSLQMIQKTIQHSKQPATTVNQSIDSHANENASVSLNLNVETKRQND